MGLADRLGTTGEKNADWHPPSEKNSLDDGNAHIYEMIEDKQPDSKTQAEERQENLESALETKLMESFQGEGSPFTAELVTREVVRTFLLDKPGESKPTSINSKINALQRHLEDLLGGGDLTVAIGEDGVINYLAFPGAKEGTKKTFEVPVQGSNKIVKLEFTPLVVQDSKNPGKVIVKKVLCNEIKLIEK